MSLGRWRLLHLLHLLEGSSIAFELLLELSILNSQLFASALVQGVFFFHLILLSLQISDF